MTIFNKSLLSGAVAIASAEDDPVLNSVLLEPDGSIVVVNRYAIFAASPINSSIVKSLPFEDIQLSSPATINSTQLGGLIKAVPVDKQFKGMLENISIINGEGNILNAKYHDGRGPRELTLRSVAVPPILGNWRDRFRGLGCKGSGLKNFVYNRARLKTVTDAIEASCKYSGEFSFVSQEIFSNGYVWRAINELNGAVVLVAWTLPTVEEIKRTAWEVFLFNKSDALVRPRIVR